MKCRRLSGVRGPCTKHCDEGGVGLNSLHETHWMGEKCGSLPEAKPIPNLEGRRWKTASLPRLFGMLKSFLHILFSIINWFPVILQK